MGGILLRLRRIVPAPPARQIEGRDAGAAGPAQAPVAQVELLTAPAAQDVQAGAHPGLGLVAGPGAQHRHPVRAQRPGRRQPVELLLQPVDQLGGDRAALRRHRIGAAHAGQAQRLVRRPQLPGMRREFRRLAVQAQRRIGAVDHQHRVGRVEVRRRGGVAGRTARLGVPDQIGRRVDRQLAGAPGLQPQRMRRGGIFAIGVVGHLHPRARLEHRDRQRHAADELAGAGGDHDARRIDLMQLAELAPQRAEGRIGIAPGIDLAHHFQRHRRRPAGIGIGGEVPARHAVGIGPAMRAREIVQGRGDLIVVVQRRHGLRPAPRPAVSASSARPPPVRPRARPSRSARPSGPAAAPAPGPRPREIVLRHAEHRRPACAI